MEIEHQFGFEECERVAEAYRHMLLTVDPAVFGGAGCERFLELIVRTRRAEAVAEARAARRAVAANRWLVSGDRSPGDWLSRTTGTTPGRARRDLAMAEDLAAAPATEHALAEGRVSPEQAAEIAAAARVDPAAEARLLAAAPSESLAEVQRRARKVRAAATDEGAQRERIRKRRHLRHWTDAEGAFCFTGRGLPEDGAAVLAALKPHRDAAFAAARRAGEHEPSEAYAYDALIHHLTTRPGEADDPTPGDAATSGHRCRCEEDGGGRSNGNGTARTASGNGHPRWWEDAWYDAVPPRGRDDGTAAIDHDHGHRALAAATTGGSGTARHRCLDGAHRAAGSPARPARPPAQIILIADVAAMKRGHTVPGETCEIAGVGPVAVAAARELLGDGFLALVLTDGVDIRNVTHLGRAPTAHQRTALEARGRVCAVPGCGRTVGLEIDHVDGWALTRRTHIDQLDWLCGGVGGHHHRKTHDGWTLTGPPGNRTWHPPGDHPDAEGGAGAGAAGGVEVDAGAGCPRQPAPVRTTCSSASSRAVSRMRNFG